jgi:4-diphosphocytidyl-2-C-methyl-D-erythritol kinase
MELLAKKRGIILHVEDQHIPSDERNIAYRAAIKYLEATKADCGVEIYLKKGIPSEAGMGGGSADGAAVLVGINKLCGGLLDNRELCKIASAIGADVPFCIEGGTQRLGGIGTDHLERFSSPELTLVIAKPCVGVSTPVAYGYLDTLYNDFSEHSAVSATELVEALRNRNDNLIYKFMLNRFEEASRGLCPESNELISYMNERSLGALLSGSGAAVFAIAENDNQAIELKNSIRNQYPDYFVSTAKTVTSGCIIKD